METTPATTRLTQADFPALFTSADATSRLGQRSYLRLVRIDLTLLVLGAALGVTGALVPSALRAWPLVAAAIVLGATVILTSANKVLRFDHDWFEGRTVAEAVKAAAWTFMMRAQPYDTDDAAAEARFITLLRHLLETQKDLRPAPGGLSATSQQITPALRQVRALALDERRECYMQQRVIDQIEWYGAKAEQSRRRAVRWFWVDVTARGAALAFSIVAIITPPRLPSLAGVFTSLAAAATAWSQMGRYDEISKSYSLTAHELIMLRGSLDGATDEERLGQVVQEVEAAIAREHTLWQAKHL